MFLRVRRLIPVFIVALLLASVPAVAAPTQSATPVSRNLASATAEKIFDRAESNGADYSFRQKDGRAVHVKVDQSAKRYQVVATVAGAKPFLKSAASNEGIESVFVGDLASDGNVNVVVATRGINSELYVTVDALRGNEWVTILDYGNMPEARLTLVGNTIISAMPHGNGSELHRLFQYSDSGQRFNDHRFTVVPAPDPEVVTAQSDAAITNAEEAAFHITAFAEGSMVPWNGANQPYNAYDPQGYIYGMISGNSDGALLSFGVNQWNFYSDTIRPLLQRFRTLDSTAFWNVFGGLNVTDFNNKVMSTSATAQTAYAWAQSQMSGGYWSPSGCTYTPNGPCRYYNGTFNSAWTTAFSRLGNVPAFQVEQRRNAYTNYLSPTRTGDYANLNSWTGKTFSLRAYVMLEDFANQFGTGYIASGNCSLYNWVYNPGPCNKPGLQYQSGLSDKSNVQNLWQWENGYNRQKAIAWDDGSIIVNGVYPQWDSYISGYGMSMNNAPSFVGVPFGTTVTCNPGSSMSCPASMGSSVDGGVSQGASVWYEFLWVPGGATTVTLKPSLGDSNLYVYNGSGTLLGQSTNSGTTTDTASFTPSYSGYYYAKVYGNQASSFVISRP